uniref:Uncharacterized protein n=1 Tax=Denticeps clupeoides TaxID=299321 RepID=A0AAY4BRA4_9TELE
TLNLKLLQGDCPYARFQTFQAWPPSSPVRPRDLAQAGLFYEGQEDRVQCFCCGIQLSQWVSGDDPWTEHSKYSRNWCGFTVCVLATPRPVFDRIHLVHPGFSAGIHPLNPARRNMGFSKRILDHRSLRAL